MATMGVLRGTVALGCAAPVLQGCVQAPPCPAASGAHASIVDWQMGRVSTTSLSCNVIGYASTATNRSPAGRSIFCLPGKSPMPSQATHPGVGRPHPPAGLE